MSELTEQLHKALESSILAWGSYGPKYDGAKLAVAIEEIIAATPAPQAAPSGPVQEYSLNVEVGPGKTMRLTTPFAGSVSFDGVDEWTLPATYKQLMRFIQQAMYAAVDAPASPQQAQADARDAAPGFTHADALDLRYAADVLRTTGHHHIADGIFNIAARIAAATTSTEGR